MANQTRSPQEKIEYAQLANTQPDFRNYGIAALALLVVLTAAILVPDYWSYSLELEKIKVTQHATQPTPKLAEPVSDKAQGSFQAVNITVPNTEKQSATKGDGVGAEKLFETYGKLITMLLGFVSVLGVFVGFFVRKSLREIEEDIETRVEKRMELWEEQKEMVLENLREAQKKFEKITALYDEMKRALEAFQKVQDAEQSSQRPRTTAPESIAASLDSDPALDPPNHEIVH